METTKQLGRSKAETQSRTAAKNKRLNKMRKRSESNKKGVNKNAAVQLKMEF